MVDEGSRGYVHHASELETQRGILFSWQEFENDDECPVDLFRQVKSQDRCIRVVQSRNNIGIEVGNVWCKQIVGLYFVAIA